MRNSTRRPAARLSALAAVVTVPLVWLVGSLPAGADAGTGATPGITIDIGEPTSAVRETIDIGEPTSAVRETIDIGEPTSAVRETIDIGEPTSAVRETIDIGDPTSAVRTPEPEPAPAVLGTPHQLTQAPVAWFRALFLGA